GQSGRLEQSVLGVPDAAGGTLSGPCVPETAQGVSPEDRDGSRRKRTAERGAAVLPSRATAARRGAGEGGSTSLEWRSAGVRRRCGGPGMGAALGTGVGRSGQGGESEGPDCSDSAGAQTGGGAARRGEACGGGEGVECD